MKGGPGGMLFVMPNSSDGSSNTPPSLLVKCILSSELLLPLPTWTATEANESSVQLIGKQSIIQFIIYIILLQNNCRIKKELCKSDMAG